jgi:hypothetical protein
MEWILPVIAIVFGIPAVAIFALLRSRAAERRIGESDDNVSGLQDDIAGLRRELIKLSARVAELEFSKGVDLERNEVSSEPMPLRVVASPEVAKQVKDLAAGSLQTGIPTSRIKGPLPTEPKATRQPPIVLENHSTSALAEAVAATGVLEKEEFAPIPLTAIPQTPSTPVLPPVFSYSAGEPVAPRESLFQRLKPNLTFEQFLGINLFAKIGIVLLVLGLAFLGRIALTAMGPAPRVALIYAIATSILGGGIWLEHRERYQLLGRAGIGGGWALLFFTTYAMHHVAPMEVMESNTLNCVLMLIVAAAMVVHTLRYRSQVVTGLAFLLAFSTVALSQDTVYALAAGVILALSVAAIALRMSWFELEIFGILASYANHFYWLQKHYPHGSAGHDFPEFWPSAIILILYWAIFRISYVARKVASPRQESLSTLAALANTMLLLAIMKFQSTHPELAFYALLGLGALEFIFGQLPVTRRRRAAFLLLTTVGTLLIFTAVPFKFTGNSIALFWMIASEALLIAGIVQSELVFRRLGLFAGGLTGLLIVYEAHGIVALRLSSEALLLKDGILLATCAALFYLNALYLSAKCREHLESLDTGLVTAQSYIGCITAFLGVWALLTADLTAVGWAMLLLAAVYGASRLKSRELLLQAWVLSGAALIRALLFNWRLSDAFPHHLIARELTLPILSAIFYCGWWVLGDSPNLSRWLRSACLWIGTALLAALASAELPVTWIAPAWIMLAVLSCLFGRRFCLRDLLFQEHVLAAAAVVALSAFNLGTVAAIDRYLPLIGCAAALYAVSRYSTLDEESYRTLASSLHTWTATALLVALAWHESSQPWLAVIWILFALALAVVDRIFSVEELTWQTHTLALLAVARAVTYNFFLTDALHGVDLRLITVVIVAAALYAIASWMRVPKSFQEVGLRHAYSWIAASCVAWLLWCELPAIDVAPGLGVFGLLLFEIGTWRRQEQLRIQAYALLTASFARIFQVNLGAGVLPGDFMSPGIYSVIPLALIYFYIWARLSRPESEPKFGGSAVSNLMAYFGSSSIVALLYYQLAPQWIIVGWAFVVFALTSAALLLDREIFLEQYALLTAGVVIRGLGYNIFGTGYSAGAAWSAKYTALILTSALLFASLPAGFRIRNRYQARPRGSMFAYYLAARRPDQILFFASLLLIVVGIAVKMDPGVVTLAWGVAGVIVIPIGLLASQRSYRLSGLALLLLCVGKIIFHDAWQLDERNRYMTFIVLGVALILVSALYSKYRGQVSRLL